LKIFYHINAYHPLKEYFMKTNFVVICLAFCCLFVLAPSAMAVGGDEGWITIQCNVDDASVYFDGSYKGVINGGSLTVAVYTTGAPYSSYSVEKSGYTTYTGSMTMPGAGETRTYYATLNPIPTPVPPVNYGSIYVQSSPSGANIYFSGNYRGTAPLTINEVWPGSYPITAEMSGYNSYKTTTTVYAGQQSTVYCSLVPVVTTGALYVISDPSNANVYLDGVYKGRTPLTLNNLATDTHTIEIDSAGYYDWKSSVTVPVGGTKTVSATLNPMPVSSAGWIYVSSSPGGASVKLDGNQVGQTPYSGSLKLNNIQVGSHTVDLSMGGYQTYTTTVSVSPNTVSEVSAILQPTSTPAGSGALSVSSTPSGANVYLDNNFVGITPVTLQSVGAGSHLITLKMQDYQEYSTTVQVNDGATSTVSAALSAVATPTQKSPLTPFIVFGALFVIGLLAVRCRK
jgi:hypothetical protein